HLAGVSISVFAAAIALAGSTLLHAHAAPWDAAPAAGTAACGVISCTVYLSIVFNTYPAPWPIEITQAVQQPDNSVTLVQDRPTFVRLTITSTTAHAGVGAYLHGSNKGVALPGSPIAALNNPRTLQPTAERVALNDTFNFQLPPSWLNGNVTLYGYATNGSTFTASGGPTTVSFAYADPMHVSVVPIAYTCTSAGAGTTTPVPPYTYLTNYTYRVFPVPSIVTSTHASVGHSGPCLDGLPDPTGGDWSDMLDTVTDVWIADGSPDSYYYGLVKVECSGGCIAGIGWLGFYKAGAGFDGFGGSHFGASEVHAHEVGHNHGRSHTHGCGASGSDPAFPYVSGGRGYIGDRANPNYGFDAKPPYEIYPYATYFDIMNYCDPQWVSDYTYEAFRAWNQTHRAIGPAAARNNRALMISGHFDPTGGQVTFHPAYALDIPVQLPDPGDYTLELLDADGQTLAAYSFAPAQAHADRLRVGSAFEKTGFHMALPYAEGVASIRVRRGSAILGRLQPGARAPALRAGISALAADGQPRRVRWSGSEADGDSLRYLVRASTDGGATWQTIGVNRSAASIDLNPIDFGGKSVLVEVFASDGLHTTALRLGPFTVP
ncbi:MAG: hypothetical protein ACRDGG_04360, partial [Anaerolineae bacterium]